MKPIAELKGGDPCVARKIDEHGRYDFKVLKVDRRRGPFVECSEGLKFSRKDGLALGTVNGNDLSKWQLFDYNDPEITAQLQAKIHGPVVAIPPEEVKLMRALEKLKGMTTAQIQEMGLGDLIVFALERLENPGQFKSYTPTKK